MDDGESERGSTRVELNLSMASPFLPQHQIGDLGSELAFNLLPLAGETSDSSSFAAGALVASFLDAALSPSNSLDPPELVPFGPLLAAEATQYSPPSPSSAYSPRSPVAAFGTPLPPERRTLDSPFIHAYVRINEDSYRPNAPDNHSVQLGVHDNPSNPSDHVRIHRRQFASPADPPYSVVNISELTSTNGASARQELREFPEFRIQRLIELATTRLARNFTPSHSSEGRAAFDPQADVLTCPERLMHNILRSRRSLDASRNTKAGDDGKKPDGSDDMLEAAANFECNICYDLAKDPVVTPCGHLFCWSCIYQWLYAHSKHSECPVCKGQVLEINVTPIYGHGGTKHTEKNDGQDEVSSMKIPPRPPAHRVECFSQQLHRSVFPAVQEVEGSSSNSNTGVRSYGTRSRARVIPRDEPSGATNLAAFDFEINAGSNSQTDNVPGLRQRSRRHVNLTTLATSSPDSQVNGLSLRRRNGVRIRFAVVDTTAAVTQGDLTTYVDAATGTRMAGSSSTSVIRERSNSGSLDSDEEFAQTYSRRRLN